MIDYIKSWKESADEDIYPEDNLYRDEYKTPICATDLACSLKEELLEADTLELSNTQIEQRVTDINREFEELLEQEVTTKKWLKLDADNLESINSKKINLLQELLVLQTNYGNK